MQLDALVGRYNRLRRELSAAYERSPWQSGMIDRLANDLATTEREIAALQSQMPMGALVPQTAAGFTAIA